MDQPLVSVLMTAYNREAYIGDAINSVIRSSYSNFELIVVDDGSTDKSVEIAKTFEQADPRIKVFVNPENLGDYANRNRAASYASGKYLKYLDSDDLIYPFGLEVFVTMMEQYPSAALGVSSTTIQKKQPFPIIVKAEKAHYHHFFEESYLQCGPSGVIIRHDIFKKFGGFSGKRMVGDVELWLKISADYDVMILPASLIFWRKHEGQEFFDGVRNGVYLEMELPMIENALATGNTKLTEKEQERVLKFYRKSTARGIINMGIKQGKLGEALKLIRKMKISAGDFINAMFFIKKGI